MSFKWNFFSKKILSIDIGRYETKVVEGKKTNKGLDIKKYFSFLTPEGVYEDGYILEPELLHYLLMEEMRKNKMSSKIGYMTVKSTSIITKEIKLPVVKNKDIEGILKYEMEEYLPIEKKDFVIQYKLINKVKNREVENLNILLIAVPEEIVEGHFLLLKDLELNPTVLDVQLNSISKLFQYNNFINREYSTKNTTFALIDLAYSDTSIGIIKNGKVLLNEAIKIGGRSIGKSTSKFLQLSQQEFYEKIKSILDINSSNRKDNLSHDKISRLIKANIDVLMDEINLVFEKYKSKYVEDKIQIIFLHGGLSNIGGMDIFFQNHFKIPSIKIEDMDKVNLSENLNKYINCVGSIIRNGE